MSAYCYPYTRKRPIPSYGEHYSTGDWYNSSLSYTKAIKMEPSTSFCYANDTTVTAMHPHASAVYPSASVDPYTGHHYIAAGYAGIHNTQYCGNSVDSSYQPASTTGYSMIQYVPPGIAASVSPVPSPEDGSCLSNPLTPPHDDSLIRHSPSASPCSVNDNGYHNIIPIQTISGSIHLPGK